MYTTPGLLQPLPVPKTPWKDITIDFIDGLQSSRHKNAVLVVIAKLTKYGHFIPLQHPYTTQEVASLYLK